ncbi:MAG: tyrosine--tRNA ligase [archaeon]
MNSEERLNLVKRNAVEIITVESLENLLRTKRKITAYYGTAPTGPVHIGHLATLTKIFDFSEAGIFNKILIADLHAALDDLKSPWSEINKRAEYYKKCIELALPWRRKPKVILGSDFQLRYDYMLDVLKLSSLTTVSRAKRAASEVCRMKEPKVSEMIYPLLQALDEQYLDADIQLGGMDQRHIMVYAREYLPKVDYNARVEIIMPLITSLKGPGVKMSSSLPETHIKVYDSEDSIKEKIRNAYCPAGIVKDNPLLQICQTVIFPLNKRINVERDSKFGGDISFDSYPALEKQFTENKLHPLDLKNAVSSDLIKTFSRARKYFEKNSGMLENLGSNFLP